MAEYKSYVGRKRTQRSVTFFFNLCSSTRKVGKWVARKRNQELGRRLRNALAELRKTRGYDRVRLRHIYSHTRDRGNETADRLAKAAARTADFSGDGAPVLRLAQETFEESGAPSSPATARPQQVHVVDQTLGQELGDG